MVAIQPPDAETPSARGLPPPPEQFVPAPRLADIHFDYDVHTIRPEDAPVLDENAAWLRTNPAGLVLIEGHTDSAAPSEYNLVLGDLRAAAAMGYLVAHGIAAGGWWRFSYGEGAADLRRAQRGVLGPEPSGSVPDQAPLMFRHTMFRHTASDLRRMLELWRSRQD